MTQEEKAKAYDEAISMAEKFYTPDSNNVNLKATLEMIFPELKESKESEDEKIRKELLQIAKESEDSFYMVMTPNKREKLISWLEKQGEQKFIDDLTQQEAMDIAVAKCFNEQKPTDNVEPKFHEGEWITNGDYTWQIVSVTDLDYTLRSQDGNIVDDIISHVDEYFHSFSIQDAKDGDVLFLDLMGGKTFIYNGINPDMAILYSFIISNDGEDVLPYHIGKPNTGIGYIEENKNIIHPATKEQRDLLFQKMKEAGYEWNTEKKELKKIEQKPAEQNVDNRKLYNIVIEELSKYSGNKAYKAPWALDSTGVQYPFHFTELGVKWQKEQKTAWSEEDEGFLNLILAIFTNEHPNGVFSTNGITVFKGNCVTSNGIIAWLTSLKNRIQSINENS